MSDRFILFNGFIISDCEVNQFFDSLKSQIMNGTIPRIVWQTYRNRDELPPESIPCRESWLIRNPGWQIKLVDDESARESVERFDPSLAQIFDQLPHGAMKADLWRYVVLFMNGGVYADIDTSCNSSLDIWMRDRRVMHVACENGHPFFCQWAFSAPAGHPVLEIVLELIRERFWATDGVDTSMPGYPHHYTGPGIWTAAIQRYLDSDAAPEEILQKPHLWDQKGIIIYSPGDFTWGKIGHGNASLNWNSAGYRSWQRDRHDQE